MPVCRSAQGLCYWVRELQIASLRLFVVFSRVPRSAALEVTFVTPGNSPQSVSQILIIRLVIC